jgi:hypothetical protein
MHQPVMVATKLHKIRQAGLTIFAPVLDIVPVYVVFERTAWELAAFVVGNMGIRLGVFLGNSRLKPLPQVG